MQMVSSLVYIQRNIQRTYFIYHVAGPLPVVRLVDVPRCVDIIKSTSNSKNVGNHHIDACTNALYPLQRNHPHPWWTCSCWFALQIGQTCFPQFWSLDFLSFLMALAGRTRTAQRPPKSHYCTGRIARAIIRTCIHRTRNCNGMGSLCTLQASTIYPALQSTLPTTTKK